MEMKKIRTDTGIVDWGISKMAMGNWSMVKTST